MGYGYALTEDSERWHTGEETIVATIAEAISSLHGGDKEPVAICECMAPDISFDGLADTVIERADEILYEEVGEVADTFGPFTSKQKAELAEAIRTWFDKHGAISCWKAENGRLYGPGDPEYDEAAAAIDAALQSHPEGSRP